MLNILQWELLRLLAALLAGYFLGGWTLNQAWFGLLLGFSALCFWHGRQWWQLVLWIASSKKPTNKLKGAWAELAYQIYRRRSSSRDRIRSLTKELGRTRRAVAYLPDAAVILNQYHEILWSNRAAGRLLDLHKSDVGRPLSDLLREPELLQFIRQQSVAPDHQQSLTLTSVTDRHLSLRYLQLYDDQYLLIAQDISLKQRLDDMRKNFVASVSHELRTPITVISGYLEYLEEEGLSADDMTPLVNQLHAPTKRLRLLVDDLSFLSRLDSEEEIADRDLHVINMPALFEQLAQEANALALENHVLVFNCDQGVEIKGSLDELHSAFTNLISNALRYSPDGGNISVRWARQQGQAVFSVSDRGLGIAEEDLPRLTERFYRVDKSRSRSLGGTGLGLAIVKHILLRHGAHLQVQSAVGQGSTFLCNFDVV